MPSYTPAQSLILGSRGKPSLLLVVMDGGLMYSLRRLLVGHPAGHLRILVLRHDCARLSSLRAVLDFGLHLCESAREAEVGSLYIHHISTIPKQRGS